MRDEQKTKAELIAELKDLRNRVSRLQELGEARRKREKRLQKVLEFAKDAILITNERGEIMLTNALTEALFGYVKTELVGRRIEMLMPEEHRKDHKVHVSHYMKSPRTRAMGKTAVPLYGQRKNGERFPVEISLAPMETDEGVWIYSTIRDITELEKIRKQRTERDKLLKDAGQAFKILEGILSICSSCHKVHDEGDNQWKFFEQYLSEHYDVAFSHGICPPCFQELYPQFYQAYLENGK